VRLSATLLAGAVAGLLAPLVLAQAPPPSPLTLVTTAERRTLATTMVDGREMIGLDTLTGVVDLTVEEDALAGGITVTVNGRAIAIAAGQSMASVDGRLVALPAALARDGTRWLVPLEFIPRALAPVAGTTLDLRPASRLLVAGSAVVPRATARIDSAGPPTRVTVELVPAVPVTALVEAGRVVVRVEAHGVDLAGGAVAGAGLVGGVRVDTPTTLVVPFAPDAAAPRVTPSVVDGTARVVIEVPSAAAASPVPRPFPLPDAPDTSATTLSAAPAAAPPLARSGVTLDVIVIDPGHGGDDAGVRGPRGTAEKAVTLAVAEQLRTLIETRLGVRVLLTRESDRTVLLDQRTALANNNKAGLFLSLHAGGALSPDVDGAEVWQVRLDREGEAARQRAATATALPVLGGGTRAIDAVRWDLAQAPHVDASSVLAGILVEELARRVPMGPRARRDAPLRLLMGANMPAAMIELGYLTSPEQEPLLASGPFQATLAEALYDAVLRFRTYLEGGGA
jgi:N-acetylmuramoyl-L-alanine amidase